MPPSENTFGNPYNYLYNSQNRLFFKAAPGVPCTPIDGGHAPG